MAYRPRNVLKILLWLSEQEPGKTFTCKGLSKTLNLESHGVANILRYQEGVKKGGRTRGYYGLDEQIWIVTTPPPRPSIKMNMNYEEGHKL